MLKNKKFRIIALSILLLIFILIFVNIFTKNFEITEKNEQNEEQQEQEDTQSLSYLLNQEGPVYELSLFNQDLRFVPQDLEKYPELETLILSQNYISDLRTSEVLFNLINLKHLDLEYNLLEEIPSSIERLENLEGLYLSGNNLKTLPEEIKNLENLKTITLIENDFTDAEKENLKNLLPNTAIIFEFVEKEL